MPYRPYRRMQGPVQWNSPVASLRYIGPYFAGILQNLNMNTLYDIVVYFSARADEATNTASPENYLFQKFAEVTRNQNAQTCQEGYLPRPINRMAFNALVDLVAYAAAHPQELQDPDIVDSFGDLNFELAGTLVCRMNEGHGPSNDPNIMCDKLPLMGNVGDEPEITSMRRCPCINDANACNGDCVWSDNACISRNADYDRHNYAPDLSPFYGDWYGVNAQPPHTRPGTRYVVAGQGRVGRMFAFGQEPEVEADDGYDNGGGYDDNSDDGNGWVQIPPPYDLPVPAPAPVPIPAPAPVARLRRPARGREVTPDPNPRPRGSRRPRRSLRLKEKQNRKK